MKEIDGRFVVSLAFDSEQSAIEFEHYVQNKGTTMMPMPEALVIDPGRVIGNRPDIVNMCTGPISGLLVQHGGAIHGSINISDKRVQ